jgi:hypothetical protein
MWSALKKKKRRRRNTEMKRRELDDVINDVIERRKILTSLKKEKKKREGTPDEAQSLFDWMWTDGVVSRQGHQRTPAVGVGGSGRPGGKERNIENTRRGGYCCIRNIIVVTEAV